MYCPSCGATIEGEARSCDACGKPLQESAVAPKPSSSASGILGLADTAQAVAVRPEARPAPAADTRPLSHAGYSKKWNNPATSLSHWNQLIRGLEVSATEFYQAVRTAIERRRVPEVRLAVVKISEGGMFSAKREYLRVIRKGHVLDICAAPYGDGFFVSWWLGPRKRILVSLLLVIPFFAWLYFGYLRRITYYSMDTGSMFLTSVHSAVLEVIDALTETRGIRGLTELERKPIHRSFWR